MPSYKSYTKAQLQQLCDERGISSEGCTKKADYIRLLEQFDEGLSQANLQETAVFNDEMPNLEGHGEEEGYDEGRDEGHDEGHNESGDTQSDDNDDEIEIGYSSRVGSSESEAVVTLKLQLALAREQRKAQESRERMMTQGNGQNTGQITNTTDFKDIKHLLPKMTDVDILSFFMAFERVLELNEIDRSHWARLLPSQMSPKALKFFARLSLDESKCYETIKRTVMNAYKLDAKAYLHEFRTMRRRGQSTYKMFLTNLREVMYHYFNACEINSFETLTERFLMEQFASSLPENVRAFVHAKQPQNAEQMALFADLSYEVSNIGKESGGPLQNNAQRTGRIEVGRYPGHIRNPWTPGQANVAPGNSYRQNAPVSTQKTERSN